MRARGSEGRGGRKKDQRGVGGGGGRVGSEADTLGIRRPEIQGGKTRSGGAARAYGGGEGSVACCPGGYMWLPVPRDVDGGLW